MYDDDALHEFPVAPEGRPERLEGKAAIAKHVKILPSVVLFESFDARVREAGDKLIVETNADGRHPATGAPFYMQYVWFITHKHGRVSGFRDCTKPLRFRPPREGVVAHTRSEAEDGKAGARCECF